MVSNFLRRLINYWYFSFWFHNLTALPYIFIIWLWLWNSHRCQSCQKKELGFFWRTLLRGGEKWNHSYLTKVKPLFLSSGVSPQAEGDRFSWNSFLQFSHRRGLASCSPYFRCWFIWACWLIRKLASCKWSLQLRLGSPSYWQIFRPTYFYDYNYY